MLQPASAAEMAPIVSRTVTPSVPPPPEFRVPAPPPMPIDTTKPPSPGPETYAPSPVDPRTETVPMTLPAVAPRNPEQAALPPEQTIPVPSESIPTVSQPLHGVPGETMSEIQKQVEEEGVYFNVADEDIREVIKQISRALGKNFIIDDKIKGKITIISERKMTKDEIWEAFQSALEVVGYTVVQGPAGLLKFVQTKEAIQNPIDFYTEDSPFTDRFITRLITLKNISASDMANAIKGMVSKEGNLFAYPVTNTLIITDSGTNIDRLVKLIQQLDREGPQEVMEIIPVLYADVKDLAAKLSQIFETDKDKKVAAPVRRGGQAGGEEEEKSIRKILPDERTNSLIVLASKRAIQDVHDLIKKLDSPLKSGSGTVHVYYLRHAKAKDLTAVLSALSGAISQDNKGKPPSGAAEVPLLQGGQFSGKWTVTADESNNALVITASPKDYDTLVDSVISKLDIPRRQVYVEAIIVELAVSQDQQLGAGAIGGKSFDVGPADLALFGSTFGFLDQSKLLAGAVGAGSSDTKTINTPGASGSASNLSVPGFFAALQMAQGNTEVNILSTPNLLTLDNEEAEIKVGQKIPFPSGTATTIGGSFQTTFTREDVALTLKIKPQISESDTVRLQVEQTDREVLPSQQQASLSTAGGGPATTERSVKTSIVANDHQTVVLGGLVKDKNTTVINKIPLLGDIPVLGYLFKTRQKQKQKVNLIVFLTPHIIRDPHDFLAIVQKKIQEKNAFISENFSKSQQKQIHHSLETHASQLLKYSGNADQPTEEDRFPIGEIPPTYTAPAVPRPASNPEKELPPVEVPAPQESVSKASKPPASHTMKHKRIPARKKSPPKEQPPSSPETTTRPSGAGTNPEQDIDLAY